MNKKVVVSDSMQKKYSYVLTAPVGKKFDPQFKPQLTPRQMLALGIFGGIYMRDCTKEFPKSWFAHAKLVPQGIWKRDKDLNCFGVNASQPLSVWKKNGWIYKEDPRGWFQWYCRYYMGRRIPVEDARQIKGRRFCIGRMTVEIFKNCGPCDKGATLEL